jgi:hypothetical protein
MEKNGNQFIEELKRKKEKQKKKNPMSIFKTKQTTKKVKGKG